MKKFKLLSLLLVLFISLTGCSKANANEISSVASNFVASSLSYDFNAAKQYCTGEALDSANLVEAYVSFTAISAKVSEVKILNIETSKNYADVQAFAKRTVTTESSTTEENKTLLLKMVNLNDAWYVYDVSTLTFE